MDSIKDLLARNFRDAAQIAQTLSTTPSLLQQVEILANELTQSLNAGNKLLVCGNGGSYCDALHFAEELTGRYRKDRRPLGAIALGEASHMSCVANDYGFDEVFSRQVEALGQSGDLLVVISTSGNSKNILKALNSAKTKKIKTFGLLGKDGGKAKELCDWSFLAPGQTTDRIQEAHMLVIHSVIEMCERALFPNDY